MELYRKNKVNPLGGCLPLLLQIPVFIALYSALSGAVELRHAPFMLWLSDMSTPDGLGITPILMGVSLYFQQKLTPTAATMDPMQQKIMQYLPLVFAFLLSLSLGLTLYWLTSNLLSIAQQQFLNRIKTPELQDCGLGMLQFLTPLWLLALPTVILPWLWPLQSHGLANLSLSPLFFCCLQKH